VSVDGTLGFGDLFVDAAQGLSGPVVAVLVVDHPAWDSAGLLRRGRWPGLGQHQTIRNVLVGMGVAPFAHDVGQERNPGSEDVGQSRGVQGDLVGFGDHPGISNYRHVGEPVRGLEGVDHRHHGGGLGFVALEGGHRQREPGRIGKQPEGDLRIQPALLGEPGLTEAVAGVGFEVQCGDVIEQ
jgi:hypothetical protein